MNRQLINSETLEAWLTAHPQWSIKRKSLYKQHKFADFSAAWGFMNRVALLAEQLNHHPDWCNSYSRVEITLTTHDAGGITSLDLQLAEAIDTF